MGELSAPAFDMMPDTTVSPMPEKISSPAPVAVLEEPAAEIQPEISGDFMPDTFPPEPSQAAPVPARIFVHALVIPQRHCGQIARLCGADMFDRDARVHAVV